MRLIEVDVAGVDPEQGLKALREQIVPAISALPGFESGTWLTGGVDSKGLSLTLWDSEENARAMGDRFGPGQARARARRSSDSSCAKSPLPDNHATPRHASAASRSRRHRCQHGRCIARA